MKEFTGKGVSNGIAVGKLYFFENSFSDIPDYEIDDIHSELERYHNSMILAKDHLGQIYENACKKVTKNEAVIFKTHIMLLEDSKLVELVETAINKRKNAEAAIVEAYKDLANVFKQFDDEYFRARYNDILDAAHILLKILQNKRDDNTAVGQDKPVIIAAANLFASDTILFNKENLLGILTNEGSNHSHTAILARTMGVPYVTQIDKPLKEYHGKIVIIDGHLGKVIIDPDKNTLALYNAKQELYTKQQQRLKNQIGLPSQTKNKQYVRLSADIGRLEDIDKAKANDADGIGIFRSEMLFTSREKSPSEAEQIETYKTLLKAFGEKGVVINTVNGGSGKGMDYLDIPHEKNPALGFKGIRISLENPEFLRTQLRALYRASVYGKLSILLPMVSSLEEIDYVKREINKIQSELKLKGTKFRDDVKLGVMIETPAAAIMSDDICKMVDFVNINTDNLTQYTLAMDKENQKLVDFYRPYHPAVRRLIKMTIDNARKYGKPVAVSGQCAADTAITKFLLAMKADEIVLIPSNILKVKAAVRDTDTSNPDEILKNIF